MDCLSTYPHDGGTHQGLSYDGKLPFQRKFWPCPDASRAQTPHTVPRIWITASCLKFVSLTEPFRQSPANSNYASLTTLSSSCQSLSLVNLGPASPLQVTLGTSCKWVPPQQFPTLSSGNPSYLCSCLHSYLARSHRRRHSGTSLEGFGRSQRHKCSGRCIHQCL